MAARTHLDHEYPSHDELAQRNRARFPLAARLVVACRAEFGGGCVVLHAQEGGNSAGTPPDIVSVVSSLASSPEPRPVVATPPARAVTTEGQCLLIDVARDEANRYRAMSPVRRGKYLREVGAGWWLFLPDKRRAQIEALPTD